MAKITRAPRNDGLVNLITGLGVAGRDKSIANLFDRNFRVLDSSELEAIYRAGGVGRRIIDLPIGEMTREWFEVEGDSDGLCLGYLESLHTKAIIQDALRWGDLFGGSLVVMRLDDAEQDVAQPLNESRLRGIVSFQVYDRQQVTWTTGDLETDPAKPLFNQPMQFRVTPFTGTQFVVHESRTMKFLGAKIPPRAEREQQGWGDSMLQAPYEALRNATTTDALVAVLLEEFSIGRLTIDNLVQLLSRKDGEAEVRRRLDVIDYGKSVLRTMLLAKGETFDKVTQSLAGLADVQDRQAQRLSAATGIPVTLLYGEPPSGLQATGEANRKNWYDEIRSRQEIKLLPQLERLVRYVYISRDGPTQGKEPKNWKIDFCALDQPTQLEEATLRKTVADMDVAYVDAGVLEPAEVAISRFGGDRYSTDTVIDETAHLVGEPLPVQANAPALTPASKPNGSTVPQA